MVQIVGDKPLFVTHFPKAIKFFNMRENDENPNIVNSADLPLPISGEAVGAAERKYCYEKLYERLVGSHCLGSLLKREKHRGLRLVLKLYKEHQIYRNSTRKSTVLTVG